MRAPFPVAKTKKNRIRQRKKNNQPTIREYNLEIFTVRKNDDDQGKEIVKKYLGGCEQDGGRQSEEIRSGWCWWWWWIRLDFDHTTEADGPIVEAADVGQAVGQQFGR